jgi:zinc transport system ATP-binding protein
LPDTLLSGIRRRRYPRPARTFYYTPMALTLPHTTPLLAADTLSITLGGKRILEAVDLAVLPGEIVTLIGPNGSGKTTLVRALLGLVAPSSGRVLRNAKRVAYVPQFFARDWSLPLNALRFVADFGGGSETDALAMLKRTGADQAANRHMASLSGGEMARVALARALLRRPDILVLDEPLAGVDLAGEAALYELIGKMRDETGVAIFLVSHDLHIVMAAADRVICLNGHVCCEGDARDVVKDPAFISLFGPRLAQQLALYTHHHDHSHAPSGAVLSEVDGTAAPDAHGHDHKAHDHEGHDHHGHDHHDGDHRHG